MSGNNRTEELEQYYLGSRRLYAYLHVFYRPHSYHDCLRSHAVVYTATILHMTILFGAVATG